MWMNSPGIISPRELALGLRQATHHYAMIENARASLSAAGASLDIRRVEVVFEPGDIPQLEVELRAIADAGA